MPRRIVGATGLFITLILFSLTIVSSQTPTPPSQPAVGPGEDSMCPRQ